MGAQLPAFWPFSYGGLHCLHWTPITMEAQLFCIGPHFYGSPVVLLWALLLRGPDCLHWALLLLGARLSALGPITMGARLSALGSFTMGPPSVYIGPHFYGGPIVLLFAPITL